MLSEREELSPLFNQLAVRNFQSLRRADLRLGKLTVVVGPSSSGKSALLRAVRMLAANARGSSYVTRGEKTASVSLTSDSSIVSITRGESHGSYRLVVGEDESVFTKLGGTVPEQVTEALRLDPFADGQSLNFAGQFDMPLLLAESGSTVARRLGELTNVNVIFEAAREAERRRKQAQGLAKLRSTDLASLQSRLQDFADLKGQLERCKSAEESLAGAAELKLRVARLQELLASLSVAESVLSRSRELPEIPSLDKVREIAAQRDRLVGLVLEWRNQAAALNKSTTEVEERTQELDQLHAELHRSLLDAGTCPTCGRTYGEEE